MWRILEELSLSGLFLVSFFMVNLKTMFCVTKVSGYKPQCGILDLFYYFKR